MGRRASLLSLEEVDLEPEPDLSGLGGGGGNRRVVEGQAGQVEKEVLPAYKAREGGVEEGCRRSIVLMIPL